MRMVLRSYRLKINSIGTSMKPVFIYISVSTFANLFMKAIL